MPRFSMATFPYYAGLLVMLLRSAVFFLLRGRLPERVLMDSGARIRGMRNIHFRGWAKIGAYALLDARSCARVELGDHFSLGDHSILRCSGSPLTICPGVAIGHHVTFGPYCNIGGGFGLTIGDDNIFGPYVSLHPETHIVADLSRPIRQQGVAGKGIAIGSDNWFGAKVTILDGASIGSGNIIAAGAVVTSEIIGSRKVIAGIPARQVGVRD